MKKIITVAIFLVSIFSLAFSQPPRGIIDVDTILERKIFLDSANANGTDTLRFPIAKKWFWSDTISFQIDVTSDSTRIGKSDSIGVDVRVQWLTVNGIADTTTWDDWQQLIVKPEDIGQAAFSTNPMTRQPSQILGQVWVEVYNAYPTSSQNANIRVYKIDRWLRRP